MMPAGKPPPGVMLAAILPGMATELGIATIILRDVFQASELPCLCMQSGCTGLRVNMHLERPAPFDLDLIADHELAAIVAGLAAELGASHRVLLDQFDAHIASRKTPELRVVVLDLSCHVVRDTLLLLPARKRN